MKLQPFNLDQWLELGEPNRLYTKERFKVLHFFYMDVVLNSHPNNLVLFGLIDKNSYKIPCLWDKDGISIFHIVEYYTFQEIHRQKDGRISVQYPGDITCLTGDRCDLVINFDK